MVVLIVYIAILKASLLKKEIVQVSLKYLANTILCYEIMSLLLILMYNIVKSFAILI